MFYNIENLCHHVQHIFFYFWLKYEEIWIKKNISLAKFAHWDRLFSYVSNTYEHFLIMKIMIILNHIDFNVHFYLTNR
jgi:hypothetical protein